MIYRRIHISFLLASAALFIALSWINLKQSENSNEIGLSFKTGQAQNELTGETLLNELGCNTCHSGLPGNNELRQKAPDLRHAGLRYRPEYLFDYLLNPQKVRHHIGASRMPDFYFSSEESLALSLFLETQKQEPDNYPNFPNYESITNFFGWTSDVEKGKQLISDMTCLTCHKIDGEGELLISDLSKVGSKLNEKWVKKYLTAPYVYGGKETLMPAFFHKINMDSAVFEETVENAIDKINDITAYLMSLNQGQKNLENRYQKALQENPQITAEIGGRIFQSQNCSACHQSSLQWRENTAPNLSLEGSRVNQEWLKEFLKKPHPIRPFGFFPGSGSRMPNFKLTEEEIEKIAGYFNTQSIPINNFKPGKLSAFAKAKAKTLIDKKLSCKGCHKLGGSGGVIGPDLSALKSRLKPNFVYQMIKDPHSLVPDVVMPKIPIPEKTLSLITNYLLQQEEEPSTASYPELTQQDLYFHPENDQSIENTYELNCAPCHGQAGQSDGFNTPYLKVPATNHSDAKYMSTRPDATLFDGIYGGGDILNKSHEMPPWGNTLDRKMIIELVSYMRSLCKCEDPEWSKDNAN